MYRLTSKILLWLHRIAKASSTIGLYASGVLSTVLLQMSSRVGPSILDASWFPSILRGLIVVGVLTVSILLLKIFWLEPATRDADIITAALRYLYNSMFGQDSGHCITFLAQRHRNSRYIRPRYRFAYGTGTRLRSKARFRERSALAGTAWARPGGVKIFMKTIPDFGGNEEARRNFWQNEFKLSPKEMSRLSSRILESRWILTGRYPIN